MPIRLDSRDPDFAAFRAFLATKREVAADVDQAVRAIIADVAARGDRGADRADEKFDRVDLAADRACASPPSEIDAALPPASRGARCAANSRATASRPFTSARCPTDDRFTDPLGVELGWRWTAIEAVGLYVPGGTAAYPSSVLMNAIPAKVAGVPRASSWWCRRRTASSIRWCWRRRSSPASTRSIASAARRRSRRSPMAPQTIAPVAKIVGPGNAYVAAAKRRVFGKVGIDMIAGPSEVLIIADGDANPDWIAADLLAQAEHDAAAQSILITDDAPLADAVEQAVDAQLTTLPRGAVAGASWRDFGAIILVRDARRGGRRWPTASRPSISKSWRDDAGAARRRNPQCRRDLPRRATRPRRSATMSAAPTTCCRPRARRASPRALACSTS